MRIAVGGLTHETSTFSPVRTSRADFDAGYGFFRGEEIITELRDVNVPTGGVIDAAEELGLELVPLLWTFAYSSGTTEREAYEEIKQELLDRLRAALPLDGVILDQHGAFVVDGIDDADGDVLASVREVVGSACPVVAVFDMHANHTIRRVESVDALIGFDQYPHVDQAERGREATELLVRIIRREVRPTSAFVPLSMYIHPARQVSREQPWCEALRRLHSVEREPGVLTATIGMGFPFADVPDRGPSVIVVTDDDQAAADHHARELAAWLWSRRRDWLLPPTSVEEGIAQGEAAGKHPVILVDQADNTGASSPGDSTEILRTFLAKELDRALVLYMVDPDAVSVAAASPIGSRVRTQVGGKSHPAQGPPVEMHAEVVALSDGRFRYDGPMLEGLEGNLGPSAALRQNGVTVVCVSRPMQPIDMAFARSLGIDCSEARYIAIKGVAHFRAAFSAIAGSIISVDAAGVHSFDIQRMRFKHGRRPFFGVDDLSPRPRTGDSLHSIVRCLAEAAVESRGKWDRLDAVVGDGDFGTTMARGFGALLGQWDEVEDRAPAALLDIAARVVAREMGGTSGPLWSAGLERAARVVAEAAELDAHAVVWMIRGAIDGIQEQGGARPGEKTMLDPLVALSDALEAWAQQSDGAIAIADATHVAASAARRAAEASAGLQARRGRASHAGERSVGVLDPGAVAVAAMASRVNDWAGGRPVDVDHLVASVEGEAEPGAPATVASKKLINRVDDLAVEALRGLALAHSDILRWDPGQRIVLRHQSSRDEPVVGLISGGGSGHEPLHAGFVGQGMLTAAAPGAVFASPSVDAVVAALRAADRGRGVLQIVKNYTGDVMHFRQAAKIARAEGTRVASVLVADDLGTEGSGSLIGRRGTGGTLFVEKIAGARAREGADLADVEAVARRVAEASVSFGVALSPCSMPGAPPMARLGPAEIDVGVGIHGEAGRREPLRAAHELVGDIIEVLLTSLQAPPDARLLALVSGLGGTPLIEQQLIFAELATQLQDRGMSIERSLVGPYVTSLEMAGVLISLLEIDDELTALWDAPVHTPALRWRM